MHPFELLITSVHRLRMYYPVCTLHIVSTMCIYNILGQAHVCGALTKLNVLWSLLSTGMKVRMDIFYVDIVHAY